MSKDRGIFFSQGLNLIKRSTLFLLAALFTPAATFAQTEIDADPSNKRRAAPSPVMEHLPKPVTLVNSMVSGCDAGLKQRREQPLCIDLIDRDSFKPGEPIQFRVTVGDVPEGQLLFVSLNRLSLVSLPYFVEPTEGYNAGIPLLPTPEVQPNSTFTYTWDGAQTYCYSSDTGKRCDQAKNLPAGRYVLSAQLLSKIPTFHEDGFMPRELVALQRESLPDPISTVTRSFAIDAPLDWSRHAYIAKTVANELAFGQLANQTRVGLPNNFRNNITMTPKHDDFRQNALGRWCQTYVAGGAAKGSLDLCLPPYTVSEYGLWHSAHDSRRFIKDGQITFADQVNGLDQSHRVAGTLLGELYSKLTSVDGTPQDEIPAAPFNRSFRLDRLHYRASDKTWLFEYDVNMKQDGGRALQDDSIAIAVGEDVRACISRIVQGARQFRQIKYQIPAEALKTASCDT